MTSDGLGHWTSVVAVLATVSTVWAVVVVPGGAPWTAWVWVAAMLLLAAGVVVLGVGMASQLLRRGTHGANPP